MLIMTLVPFFFGLLLDPIVSLGYAMGLSVIGFYLTSSTVMSAGVLEAGKEWFISNK